MLRKLRRLGRRWRRWEPLGTHPAARWTWKTARRIAVGVIGGTIVLLGVVMFVTPGPALIVLPIGLAVLGLEFVWAIRWLRRIERGAGSAKDRFCKWWAKPRRA